mmetsp:Transcript_9546/g.17169  ORF Transcript_9546/g.17169 Transcript_9546/m.17169 type:complete len:245 (-) Transcript_9546:129-863(-)
MTIISTPLLLLLSLVFPLQSHLPVLHDQFRHPPNFQRRVITGNPSDKNPKRPNQQRARVVMRTIPFVDAQHHRIPPAIFRAAHHVQQLGGLPHRDEHGGNRHVLGILGDRRVLVKPDVHVPRAARLVLHSPTTVGNGDVLSCDQTPLALTAPRERCIPPLGGIVLHAKIVHRWAGEHVVILGIVSPRHFQEVHTVHRRGWQVSFAEIAIVVELILGPDHIVFRIIAAGFSIVGRTIVGGVGEVE